MIMSYGNATNALKKNIKRNLQHHLFRISCYEDIKQHDRWYITILLHLNCIPEFYRMKSWLMNKNIKLSLVYREYFLSFALFGALMYTKNSKRDSCVVETLTDVLLISYMKCFKLFQWKTGQQLQSLAWENLHSNGSK